VTMRDALNSIKKHSERSSLLEKVRPWSRRDLMRMCCTLLKLRNTRRKSSLEVD